MNAEITNQLIASLNLSHRTLQAHADYVEQISQRLADDAKKDSTSLLMGKIIGKEITADLFKTSQAVFNLATLAVLSDLQYQIDAIPEKRLE